MCLFFVGNNMSQYMKKKELKTIRVHIRVSEQLFNYLNYCSDFFGVSKTYFIKERCLSSSLYYIHSKDLDEKYLNDLKCFSDYLNDMARELNSLYKKTLEINRLDLVFREFPFSIYVNQVNTIATLWETLFNQFVEDDVLTYRVKNEIVPDYNLYFDETTEYEVKNKHLQIRVTESFYKLILEVSNSLDKSISQYISDCCIIPLYLDIESIMKNKDFLSLSKSISTNVRQIIFAEKRIDDRNIECSGRHLYDLDTDFRELQTNSWNLFKSWEKMDYLIGDDQKNLYYKYVKPRKLHSWIDELSNVEMIDYLKILKNRENHI